MRSLFANTFSAAIHLAALGALGVWSVDQAAFQHHLASGNAIVVQFSAPSSEAELETPVQTITAALASTVPVDAPQDTPQLEPATVTVERQPPLVEISEEIAAFETSPEVVLLTQTHAVEFDAQLAEVAADRLAATPPRSTVADPPQLETSALPATAEVDPGAASVDSFPRKLPSNPAPLYPRDAWLARVQGRVVLRVRVEPGGLVGDATIHASSGSSSLDNAALTTVRTWRFEPARRRNQPVAHEILVPVRFSILSD